jgi:hypothetical protein
MVFLLRPDLTDSCHDVAFYSLRRHAFVGCPNLVQHREVLLALLEESLVFLDGDDCRHRFVATGNNEVIVLVVNFFQGFAEILTGLDR